MRALVLTTIFVMLAVAVLAVNLNDKATNGGLPIVRTALTDFPKDHMLFAPCADGRFAPKTEKDAGMIHHLKRMWRRWRSAITGRFVSRETALDNPATTVSETVMRDEGDLP
jgi:hypothetical protein